MQNKRWFSQHSKATRLATRLFALLYFFAAMCSAAHQHPEMRGVSSVASATSSKAISAVTTASDLTTDRTCAVCDFIAHVVSPAQTPHVVVQTALLIPLPAFAPRTVPPFIPARFCDRSAARAPPTVLPAVA